MYPSNASQIISIYNTPSRPNFNTESLIVLLLSSSPLASIIHTPFSYRPICRNVVYTEICIDFLRPLFLFALFPECTSSVSVSFFIISTNSYLLVPKLPMSSLTRYYLALFESASVTILSTPICRLVVVIHFSGSQTTSPRIPSGVKPSPPAFYLPLPFYIFDRGFYSRMPSLPQALPIYRNLGLAQSWIGWSSPPPQRVICSTINIAGNAKCNGHILLGIMKVTERNDGNHITKNVTFGTPGKGKARTRGTCDGF